MKIVLKNRNINQKIPYRRYFITNYNFSILFFYNTKPMPLNIKPILTTREHQIVKLIINSLSNKSIAIKLGISVRTVETHRRNIFKKLNCKTALGLMRWAVMEGYQIEN